MLLLCLSLDWIELYVCVCVWMTARRSIEPLKAVQSKDWTVKIVLNVDYSQNPINIEAHISHIVRPNRFESNLHRNNIACLCDKYVSCPLSIITWLGDTVACIGIEVDGHDVTISHWIPWVTCCRFRWVEKNFHSTYSYFSPCATVRIYAECVCRRCRASSQW